MDTTDLSAKLNEKLNEFQTYIAQMPKDDMFSFLGIFVGIVLIVIAVISWP